MEDGLKTLAVQVDLADDSLRTMVEETLRALGRIGILVNSAATFGAMPIQEA